MPTSFVENYKAKCTWFDDGKAVARVFPVVTLELDDTPESLEPDSI